MQASIDISTKSDILNFLIFKRRLKQQLKRLLNVIIFISFIAFIIFCIYHRSTISKAFLFTKQTISNITNKIFEVDVKKVRVHLDKNSILDDSEVESIINKLSGEKVDKKQMMKIIDDITEENKLIESAYIRKTLSNGELSVFIKEKKVIGIFYSDECTDDLANCKRSIITTDNQIVPYHKMKQNNNILKIYGKIGIADLAKIHKTLKKYDLLEKTLHIKFYASGRFDLTLKNKLLLKFPRTNWAKSIKQFNQLDSEYLLSNDIQSIKYIDLRVHDKIFIGS